MNRSSLSSPFFSERKGAFIAKLKQVLIEKAGEHAVPAEVTTAEQRLNALMNEASAGISL